MSDLQAQLAEPLRLRAVTYNIHKGVQGMGDSRRLEIHNLALAMDSLDADFICLQEVRFMNRREEEFFADWPVQPQADFLAPVGYEAVYTTNAVTRDGEHGNALLSRWPVVNYWHEDVSDHRFEQRGLLHVKVLVLGKPVHVIVVHFGLLPASRIRQAQKLKDYIAQAIPPQAPVLVAGDFNDWGTRVGDLLRASSLNNFDAQRTATYPSRFPVTQLDHVYARGMTPLSEHAPRGRVWSRMSDHLPLIAEFELSLA